MRPVSIKGPKGRSRPRNNPFSINWDFSNASVRIGLHHSVTIPTDQVEGVQAKEISKDQIRGVSTRTNLTNFADDNSDEWKEEIMVREGLNIPDDIKEHIEDMQLMSEMKRSEVLLSSMIRSIRNVKDYLGTTDRVKAYKEGDERDSFQKNKIEVKLDLEGSVENLEVWKRKREEIKEIVRNTKDEDIIIYTFVDRKRN